mmetsp:Transcript_23078/g.47851  ORF Transcript_23078/g.47851 Transcript_23078/m.47851 type:complete len:290 (-) Transcript_23078:55-924(-)
MALTIVNIVVPVSLTLSGVSVADLPSNFEMDFKSTIASNTDGVDIADIVNFSVKNVFSSRRRLQRGLFWRSLGISGVDVSFDLKFEEVVDAGETAQENVAPQATFSNAVAVISQTIKTVVTPTFLESEFDIEATLEYEQPTGYYAVDDSGNAEGDLSTLSPTASPTTSLTPVPSPSSTPAPTASSPPPPTASPTNSPTSSAPPPTNAPSSSHNTKNNNTAKKTSAPTEAPLDLNSEGDGKRGAMIKYNSFHAEVAILCICLVLGGCLFNIAKTQWRAKRRGNGLVYALD